jgi:hypothetical protein
VSLPHRSGCILSSSELCCYRSFDLNNTGLLPVITPNMRYPKLVSLASPPIHYILSLLCNFVRFIYAVKMTQLGSLEVRYYTEATKAIHSISSASFVSKIHFRGWFHLMNVTFAFRTKRQSTNFKTWLSLKKNSPRFHQKHLFRIRKQDKLRVARQTLIDVTHLVKYETIYRNSSLKACRREKLPIRIIN